MFFSFWDRARDVAASARRVAAPSHCARLQEMATFITRFDGASSAERLAVKDLIDLAGAPTTNGSRVLAATGEAASTDAACLAGARAAEAAGELTIKGKTNLHELAFGITGINPWFGTPINPLNAACVPGGSSSGSAVAVGTGESEVAFGTDTGGSIRIPAACCGVVGLKTTRGRVSLEGVRPLAPSLDTVGPMARDVKGVIRGMALLEPGFNAASEPARLVGRVRLPAESWIDEALDAALRAAGLEIIEAALPGWDAATKATMTILAAEAWQVHGELWRRHGDELSPDVSERLHVSASITSDAVVAARQESPGWDAELAEVFARVQLLALPTLAAAPPTLQNAARLTKMRCTAPFNLAGVPALSLPVRSQRDGAGIPASLQLAGPAGSEDLLAATASAIEEAAGFSAS
jgi:amidase